MDHLDAEIGLVQLKDVEMQRTMEVRTESSTSIVQVTQQVPVSRSSTAADAAGKTSGKMWPKKGNDGVGFEGLWKPQLNHLPGRRGFQLLYQIGFAREVAYKFLQIDLQVVNHQDELVFET